MTSDEKRLAHINYAKSELRNQRYLNNVCEGYKSQMIEYETLLRDVKSPSAPRAEGGSSESKDIRRAGLLDKLNQATLQHAQILKRLDVIETFLDSLSLPERRIITDLYYFNKSLWEVANDNYLSRRSLVRKVDFLLKKF